MKIGIITVSDKGANGLREDRSGPIIRERVLQQGWSPIRSDIVPDEQPLIEALLLDYVEHTGVNLIFTTGGTGFAARDVTPEATRAVIEREAPGIAEAMRMESMKITPRAMLSRAVAGIRKQTLIINLPGSPKAVKECLEMLLPVLGHGLEVLCGTAGDCARS